jgi:hypothetical protein
MTSEELAAAGVPPTGETAIPSTNDPATEATHNSGSREDGEIRYENRSGGDEDLSNVDVDLSELVVAKTKSYPPAFVFGKLLRSMRRPGIFLLVMVVHLMKRKLLLPKQMELLSTGTSLFVVSIFVLYSTSCYS